MIRRNLFFILSTVCLTLGWISCVDNGNYTDIATYGVVNYNYEMGGPTLISMYSNIGEVAAQGVANYEPGECVLADFRLDYDNQPSSIYYTATNVYVETIIDQSPLQLNVIDNEDKSYNAVFSSVNPVTAYGFMGKLFFEIRYKAFPKQNITYSLVCDPYERNDDGSLNLYLRGKVSGDVSGSESDVADVHVFDTYNLFQTCGRDSTDVTDSNYKYRIVSVYLKYCTGIDETGNYTYKNTVDQSTMLVIPSGPRPF